MATSDDPKMHCNRADGGNQEIPARVNALHGVGQQRSIRTSQNFQTKGGGLPDRCEIFVKALQAALFAISLLPLGC